MNTVEFLLVKKSFDKHNVFKDLSFAIQQGEFVTIVGPNGSGKTTILDLISGNIQIDEGEIKINVQRQDISYIQQDYRSTLLPWKTIYKNLALPLTISGYSKSLIKTKISSATETLGGNINLSKYPYELSGGQQQLVSLLRGLTTDPKLTLLDEPFTALDYNIKREISQVLLKHWEESSSTIIMITHDLDEAILLSDKILVLSPATGHISKVFKIELDRPRRLNSIAKPEFGLLKSNILNELGYA